MREEYFFSPLCRILSLLFLLLFQGLSSSMQSSKGGDADLLGNIANSL